MALRYSIATGNFSTAGTWGLVDATSHSNSESGTASLTTVYGASSGSTTGVITVLGVALKLAVRLGTTGTMSVHLAIAGVEVPGTLITINVADLPVAATADLNGGWHLFKFASPVTLVGATSYTVEAKASNISQVTFFTTSGTNFSRCLVTTTTGAPAAGDDFIIGGEYTGAGTSNSFVVTYDVTATTDYGAASTSLVTPAAAICNKGTLLVGTTAATNYNLKLSGHLIQYSGGIFSIAAVGATMPADSTFTLQFDCATNVDFGYTCRNLGNSIGQGNPRTTQYCLLNTDEAIASTSLGVDRVTNWSDNDEIAVGSTTRTPGDCEQGTLNGAAGASTLTVDGFAGAGGGLAVAHSGTSPTQAEVILLTRNIVIRGASATLQAFIDLKATAIVDWDWVEIKWMGSATASKRGIDTACSTISGIQSFQYCSLHNFEVASSIGINMLGAAGSGFTFSNNVTFKIANIHFLTSANTGGSIVDSNIFMRNTDNAPLCFLSDVGGTFTNNTMVGAVQNGVTWNEGGAIIGTHTNLTAHSCTASGFSIQFTLFGTLTTLLSWRNGAQGLQVVAGDYTINGLTVFGNTISNIANTAVGAFRIVIYNLVSNGDTSFATTNGLTISAVVGGGEYYIYNGDFGTASGIKTAHTNDISWGSSTVFPFAKIFLFNTKLASSVEFTGQAFMSPNSIITSQTHDQTTDSDWTKSRYGTMTHEVTTVPPGTTDSVKMTPINASFKFESIGRKGGFIVQVASGQTCTPTFYVYEDASYNGARARLILKRNDSIGISADVVLDTATSSSDAAWEALTGTTVAATRRGVMEFVIDCDGTAGNLFFGKISAIVT